MKYKGVVIHIIFVYYANYALCYPQKNFRDVRNVEIVPSVDEQVPDSQNIFSTFSSLFPNHPLGHSRPPIYDDPISNHRPRHIPYALQQANSFHTSGKDYFSSNSFSQPSSESPASAHVKSGSQTSDQNVLGSGNFGVIRGGTFYEDDYNDNDDYFYPSQNNGHGRPSNNFNNYFNHQPSHTTNNNPDDFFSNFRDFADITAPKTGAFSEFHIIYVNKNGTSINNNNNGPTNAPKNIFETLSKLDEQKEESKDYILKKNKGKAKLKLHEEKINEKYNKKKKEENISHPPLDIYNEPLLALS